MSIYRVYIPPEAEKDFSEDFRLIPDGKAIFALIAPPIWLVWHKLWLPLMAYFAVALGISLLAGWQPGPAVGYLSAIPGLYLLLEGRELVVGKLRSQGWREVAIVDAQNVDEAEIKYIANMDERGLLNASSHQTMKPSRTPAGSLSGSSLGLFPE